MASFLPRGRQLPPGCRGLQEDAIEAEFPKKQRNVVEDQVLELKSKDGVPSGKRFECVEPEGVLVDHRLVRTNVTEIEPRVVVVNPVTDAFGGLSRRRIESGVFRDESGRLEFRQMTADDSPAFDLQGLGDFGKGQGRVRERGQYPVLVDGILAEDGVEDLG